MNQWPNGQNGMFPQGTQGHLNPASMYNNLSGATQFDLSQFTQGLQNGSSGSSTPAFPNQTYQPTSVVPAKRPHDGMSASPAPNQGSRSQTPNYGAGVFQSAQGAGSQFPNAPNPYAHLQHSTSNNATPSPTMQNQQFRPQSQQQQQRLQNSSPSPFPQQQGNFGNQMSPNSSQSAIQPTSTPQQNQMSGVAQQYGMGTTASMAGMQNAMQAQMNNMGGQMSAQQAYKMKLMQHQQQLRNSGMIPPRAVGGQQGQMFNPQQQMANGQQGGQMNMATPQQQQQQQLKRNSFLKAIASHAAAQGRQFTATPVINGKVVDLFALWSLTASVGFSANADRSQQWQAIATKMGFAQQQYPTAADDLRQLFATNIAQYERLFMAARAQQKQEEARMHAQQMAGLGGPSQGSPARTMQQSNQPNQPNPYGQYQATGLQNQMQAQSTPTQANAQLPQNGTVTPQQQMLQHRRASSVRKPEQMTQQGGSQALTAPSPHSGEKAAQRSPSIKQESGRKPPKFEEYRSPEYSPAKRIIQPNEGYSYDIKNLDVLGKEIAEHMPTAPRAEEMGVINMKAISLSLACGISGEVRYALDALAEITHHPKIPFDLSQCEDLLDIIIDCAEDQIEMLAEEAIEVSDALDLMPYEDVMRAGRVEEQTLQDVHEFGTQAHELDRAAEKMIAISTILRNLSFFEYNHPALASSSLIKWLSNTIRLLGTRNLLLRSYFNTQDFYKDMIVFLSNTTQSLELPSRDDALHILHFLLAFAPQPAPRYIEGSSSSKIRFASFIPAAHRYLPPAVDSLAKLLARQDPNRMLYRSIFTASSSSLAISESPLDLLTRAFALSISVLPDRSKLYGMQEKYRIAEARKAYLSQGMLAADILTTLAPGNSPDLARAWIESEDGWAVGLLNLAAVLCVDFSPQEGQIQPGQPKPRGLGFDFEGFKLIAQRGLTVMKRLAEKAGKGGMLVNGAVGGEGDGEDDGVGEVPKWEGIPQGNSVLGAMTLPNTDRVALGLLCGLHEMGMQV